jgi:large subunit ribosomal protein L17
MRHGDKINNLGRTASHRKALLSNMACSLIEHKRIVTTLAKAKALRVYVEPIITKAKTDSTHSRRLVFSQLESKEAIGTLFGEVATKVGNRPGGYTRIIKMEPRRGDAADMALIELVDFSLLNGETGGAKADTAAAPKKRTRRGSAKKATGSTNTDSSKPTGGNTKKSGPKPGGGGGNTPKIRQRKSGGA